MEKKELTCIVCPMGCAIRIDMEADEVVCVKGNLCKRGDVYVRKEVTNPTRIVTSTVIVKGGDKRQVSVKTKVDIPKDKISDCMKALKGVALQAPVSIGDIVLTNVADTGVSIIATKNVYKV